jgi:methylmalonyl-CoA mutase cobalamin-binding domain/chain
MTDQRAALIPRDLPDGRALLDDGARVGAGITVGLSLLCEQHGVRSELEYKQKMRAEARLMTTMNIGLQTWSETARALELIHRETDRRGFRIDRYQMQLDRRMGVPADSRRRAAKETGPMLESEADWTATTRTVPIQPGLGDMMIGSPMSMENARNALVAGVTYIGNMCQFAWKFPSWNGTDVDQVIEVVRALGLMASKSEDGATMQSYLDDGFPAQFRDYCSYVGWAMFERYIVNEVIGARLAISYGGLTHDPVVKTAMSMALESITPAGTCNPFYHCNTTAYTTDLDRNFGTLGVDMLYLLVAQAKMNTGAAVLPIPVTEATRIPSPAEIVQVHAVSRRIAEYAPALVDFVDWPRLEAIRDRLLEGGRQFCDNLLTGLEDLGVDVRDPLHLLLAVRRLGASEIERRFGAAGLSSGSDGDPAPLLPTDTYQDFLAEQREVTARFAGRSLERASETHIVVASTDVHEFGMSIVAEALRALGVDPIIAGTSVDPDELSDLALEAGATALLVSTHNGMALAYARQLIDELRARGLDVPVLFGGRLNQDFEGSETPLDVRDDLRSLGIHVCEGVDDMIGALPQTLAVT